MRITAKATLIAFTMWNAAPYAAADTAADLGGKLTPLGAERAGNADGSIPAWDGGLRKDHMPHTKGTHYADPFSGDKPVFTITKDNYKQYADKLSGGQKRMFELYPTYKMHVYPTRRSASFPDAIYSETKKNATQAKLAAGGNGVQNAIAGTPFPIPKDGTEAIWNFLLRFRGEETRVRWTDAAVLRNGDYTPARYLLDFQFHYNNLEKKNTAENRFFNFRQEFSAPPRLAGVVALLYEPVDQVKESRIGWSYLPGQRRVRLAPHVAYDNPPQSAEGLRTYDDYQMFNGAIDRYNWKLVGKQEMYIPYNSYKFCGDSVSLKDIIKAQHANQEHARYELHRVWVVEATLKPDVRNVYKKRVFYMDEDSWAIVVADKYDAGGLLWRLSEQHSLNYYDKPMLFLPTSVHYDLTSGRYLVLSAPNETQSPYEDIRNPDAFYTPAGLRANGVR